MFFQNKRSDDDMDRLPFKTIEEELRKGTISLRLVIGLLTPFVIVALFLFFVSQKLAVSPTPAPIPMEGVSRLPPSESESRTAPSPSMEAVSETESAAPMMTETEEVNEPIHAEVERTTEASPPAASEPDLTFFKSLKDAPDTKKEVKTAQPVNEVAARPSAPIAPSPKMPQVTKTMSVVKTSSPDVVPTLKAKDQKPLPSSGKIGGQYVIQAGSFQQKNDAEQLAFRLKQGGYDAYIVVVNIPDRGVWHRVRVGHYPDRSLADKDAEQLSQNEHLSAFVTSGE